MAVATSLNTDAAIFHNLADPFCTSNIIPCAAFGLILKYLVAFIDVFGCLNHPPNEKLFATNPVAVPILELFCFEFANPTFPAT